MATVLQDDVPPPSRQRHHTRFFTGFSLVLLMLLVAGFGPTFFFAPLFGNPLPPPHVFAHGIVGTAWFVLLLVQSSLVKSGNTQLHRRLGLAGIALAAIMFLGTVASAVLVFPRLTALGINPQEAFGGMSRAAQITRDSLGVTGFAIYVGLAFWLRSRPQVHKRLMLFGSMFLVGAAVFRLVAITMPFAPPPLTIWLIFLPLIAAMAVHDRMVLGRVSRTTRYGSAAFVVAHFAILAGVPMVLS